MRQLVLWKTIVLGAACWKNAAKCRYPRVGRFYPMRNVVLYFIHILGRAILTHYVRFNTDQLIDWCAQVILCAFVDDGSFDHCRLQSFLWENFLWGKGSKLIHSLDLVCKCWRVKVILLKRLILYALYGRFDLVTWCWACHRRLVWSLSRNVLWARWLGELTCRKEIDSVADLAPRYYIAVHSGLAALTIHVSFCLPSGGHLLLWVEGKHSRLLCADLRRFYLFPDQCSWT